MQQILSNTSRFVLTLSGSYPFLDATILDSTFVAVLYTSDTEKVLRYTDEGETVELCKWTVDISTLPTFRQNAANPPPGGFYTGELLCTSR